MTYHYNPNKVILHGGWIDDHLFVWGEQKQHKKYQDFINFQYPFLYSPFELKLQLFRNDPTSYYGTFIEVDKAMIHVPIFQRQFYSQAGEATVYQAKNEDTSFRFPIEGVKIDVNRIGQHLPTLLSWKNTAEWFIDDDLLFWIELFEAIGDEIIAGQFLPSVSGTWQLSDFDVSAWEACIPLSSVALSHPSLYTLQQKQEVHDYAIELEPIVQSITDVLLRHTIQVDSNVNSAFQALQSEKPALVRTHLQALETKATKVEEYIQENDWLEQIGAVSVTPFKIGIAVEEPTNENGKWSVSLFVQDRNNPNHVVTMQDLQIGNHPWRTNPIPTLKEKIGMAQRKIPFLENLSPTNPSISVTKEEVYYFLTEQYEQMVTYGFAIAVPQWWKNRTQQSLSVQIEMEQSQDRLLQQTPDPIMNWENLAQFNYEVSIGGNAISEEDFLKLVDEQHSLIHVKGKWMFWDPQQAKKLKAQLEKQKNSSFSALQALDIAQEDTEFHYDIKWDEQFQELLQDVYNKSMPIHEPPPSLCGTLRPYQQQGMSWLLQMRKVGFGACLADDMGLGKSIQTIAYILSVVEQSKHLDKAPFLLICPTSLIGNWHEELRKFAPNLSIYIHHGASRLAEDDFTSNLSSIDVIITSYALAFRDQEMFLQLKWNGLILDEAQHIKNIETKQRRAIKKLTAFHRLALTGTPIENRLKELWSIIDLLNHGYLGSFKHFTQTFSKEIEAKDGNRERLEQLQQLISPFILRRKKSDESLKLQLPEKSEQTYQVGLTIEQASLYQAIINDLFSSIDTRTETEKRALILSSLTKLKQICNHPAQYLKEKEPLDERSEKWDLLMTLVEQIIDRDEKLLIFTQFKEMGDLIQRALSKQLHYDVPFLHGGLQRTKREQMINKFKEDENIKVFILSLKAGGVGLNLTAATHVIHYDRWWNPAVEKQATDRAYRIGQTENVTVYKFMTKGTLEERIDAMLQRKEKLAEEVLTVGEKQLSELSVDELKELLELRL